MQTILKRFKPFLRPEPITIVILMLTGFILRIRQYLIGRSLWVDEAMLALNIVNRNFSGLFKPLDYDQGAPIGFLLAEKLFNILLGRNEYALRLFPLTLGLLSLWTFYLLLKRFTKGTGLVIALALFALNPRLIYYSSEVKQYIVDVFVTIALLLIAAQLFENFSRKKLGILAFAGLLALWLSHPSLFTITGIGVTIFFSYLQKRDLANARLAAGMGALWLVNIGVLYTLTLGNLQNNSYMRAYWMDAFAPMPPWSNWTWYWNVFQANTHSHFAITSTSWIFLLLVLAGWAVLFRQHRHMAIALTWTFVSALLASSFALYPSVERMALFLVPVEILLTGISLNFILQNLRGNRITSMLFTVALSIHLFYGAIPLTMEQFLSPKYFEHIRPAMEILQEEWQAGDGMYISNGGVPAFEYYAPMYGLEDIPYIGGNRNDYENPAEMLKRLDPLKGQQRVWILFSHVYEKGEFNEKDFLVDTLKKNGSKKREFRKPGTSVFLYRFNLGK